MTTACSCLPDQISCVLKVPTRVRHQYRLKSEKSKRRKFKLTSVDVVGRSSRVRGVLGEKEDTRLVDKPREGDSKSVVEKNVARRR